jgi:MFS family permease
VAICCVARILFSVASSAGLFVSLYLQRVLEYDPMKAGLVFLPSTLVGAVFSLALSAKIVVRFGVTWPLVIGLITISLGLMLLAWTPVQGNVTVDVLPGLLLTALGAGAAVNPLVLATMKCVPRSESGLLSGVMSTFSTVGTVLGLAVLAGVSAAHTDRLLASGIDLPSALNAGYHVAFLSGAVSAAGAAAVAVALLGSGKQLQNGSNAARIPMYSSGKRPQ